MAKTLTKNLILNCLYGLAVRGQRAEKRPNPTKKSIFNWHKLCKFIYIQTYLDAHKRKSWGEDIKMVLNRNGEKKNV